MPLGFLLNALATMLALPGWYSDTMANDTEISANDMLANGSGTSETLANDTLADETRTDGQMANDTLANGLSGAGANDALANGSNFEELVINTDDGSKGTRGVRLATQTKFIGEPMIRHACVLSVILGMPSA